MPPTPPPPLPPPPPGLTAGGPVTGGGPETATADETPPAPASVGAASDEDTPPPPLAIEANATADATAGAAAAGQDAGTTDANGGPGAAATQATAGACACCCCCCCCAPATTQQSPAQKPVPAAPSKPAAKRQQVLDADTGAVVRQQAPVEQAEDVAQDEVDQTDEQGPRPEQTRAEQRASFRRKAVALAQAELGVQEIGTSNESPRIRTYRTATPRFAEVPGPWCAYFLSWVAKKAGAPIGYEGEGMGYVPDIQNWAVDESRWFTDRSPRPGDAIVFDWEQDGEEDHIGLVERVDDDGTIHTIEGNAGSDGIVKRRTWDQDAADIRGFVRLGPE